MIKKFTVLLLVSLFISLCSGQSFVIIEQVQASTASPGCIDCGDVIVPNFWFVMNNGSYRYADMEVSVTDAFATKSVARPIGWGSAWGPTPFLDSSRNPIWHIVINDQPFRTGRVSWSSTPKRVCSIGFSALTDCALDSAKTGYMFNISAWPKRDSLDPRDSSFSFSGSMFMYECSEILTNDPLIGEDTVSSEPSHNVWYYQNKIIIDVGPSEMWWLRAVDIKASKAIESSGVGRAEIDFLVSPGSYFIVFFVDGDNQLQTKGIMVFDR